METVLSFVLLGALGIAILFVVVYAFIVVMLDSWEIK
jgi:ABC-type multidrug transport system permease subunit